MTDRCVLAYSGGLDTSVAARSLREDRDLDIVGCFVDLGQPFDRSEVEARAGAALADLRIVDARAAFAEDFCLPALHANARYEGRYPLVSALARPLIAVEVVRLARETGAGWVAHGCTGKGNDQVRFETSFAALAPDLRVLAPIREASRSREESLALAERWRIPQASEAKTYSVDENLWGRTVEAGPLEDPWTEPPPDAFALTADPRTAPDDPTEVVISFQGGRPVALDGREMGFVDLIAELTRAAGARGVGRIDMIENRLVGIKSRELYEVPAAHALLLAHRDLEDLTLERDLAHEKSALERRWAELCYYGQWHGPLHAGLRRFMTETQDRVTGEVRVRFHRGACTVVGRRSPRALYDVSLATYEGSADRFDQRAAEGFVRLWSLPIKVWSARDETGSPVPREPAGDGRDLVAHATVEPSPGGGPPLPDGRDATKPLWSGRFTGAPAAEAESFTHSLGFDRRLLVPDLLATRAHANALARAGVLDEGERDLLVAEVERLLDEAGGGAFPFADDEDVHSAVERVLTERLGEVGAKIHTGRSRNDLVVTDLRLWAGAAAGDLARETRGLSQALAERAEPHTDTPMPGYTHLQRAQPVTLAHHLLAHAFPLARDADRFAAAASAAMARCPLGAGALAASTLGIDPVPTAEALGFAAPFDNSMDAVADRDFAIDLLAACVSTAVHLSRLAEDLVLWSSTEFGFARPAEGYATGSSMMPQKRNPDVAELARAKVGRVLGDFVTMVTVLKGIPLAYDRDLQEDKEALFDAHDALVPALEAMTGMVRTVSFDTERMRRATDDPSIYATDLAESLVAVGVPFREAHTSIARIVTELERDGRGLADLEPAEWERLEPRLGRRAPELLDAARSAARRGGHGGPAPEATRGQIAVLRSRLGAR